MIIIKKILPFSFLLPAIVFANNFNKTIADDLTFIKQYDKPFLLKAPDSEAIVVVSPNLQGRVLTSALNNNTAQSNGWINYQNLKTGKDNPGGEDRFWPAPIGSKFSFFFPPNGTMDNKNWRVPPDAATGGYVIKKLAQGSITLAREHSFINHQGTNFNIALERKIAIYSKQQIAEILNINIPNTVKYLGFGSDNKLTNLGENWQETSGMATLWILGMFQGTPNAIAIFPLRKTIAFDGQIRSYLHPLNYQRLSINPRFATFKVDGKYQSKIGIPQTLSKDVIASYTPELNRLTIIKFSFDKNVTNNYPIADEKETPDALSGDVTNSYNHGDATGKLLEKSAFYELESAATISPLKTGEYVTHQHHTFHFFGKQAQLNEIAINVLGVSLDEVLAK